MLGMDISQGKRLFFDKAVVRNAARKAERQVLSKFGAYVRTRARTSIRKRRKPSKAGQPPSSHVGLLRNFIYFVYDPQRRSVIIGPARINKSTEAPATLEHGGEVTIQTVFPKRQLRTVRILPRPYMGPAFAAEHQKLPALWKDSITN